MPVTFDKSKRLFYDDLASQADDFASYFKFFGEVTRDKVTGNPQLEEYYKAMWANYLLYKTVKDSSVYVFNAMLANEIMRSTIDEPTLNDFKRIPNRRIFINFFEPIPIPEIWRDTVAAKEVFKSGPADSDETISGIQLSWNTTEQINETMKGHNVPQSVYFYASCTVGIWRKTKPREMGNEFVPGSFPNHKMRALAQYESRNVIITDENALKVKWDERGILPTAYRFLAFLSSSNVDYQEVNRELTEDKKLPKGMRPRRRPAYLPFIKNYTLPIRESESAHLIPNADPRARHVVRGHGAKYWHCPHCAKITPHLEIHKTESCKHCSEHIGLHEKWEKEWRWIPEHFRGSGETTNEVHRFMVQK